MELVINADDLGLTPAVSRGIVYGYHHGTISSTTALCNSSYLEDAALQVKKCKGLGIGVHLTLTLGKPLTNNNTLTAPSGLFFGRDEIIMENLDKEEVYQEFKAQILRFYEVFQYAPTHLDSHHSIHDHPIIKEVTLRCMSEFGLAARRINNQFQFVSGFYGNTATVDVMISLLSQHQHEQGIEIMVHPGECDLPLYLISSYSLNRVKELEVLCNKEIKDYINEHDITLVHY